MYIKNGSISVKGPENKVNVIQLTMEAHNCFFVQSR